MPTVESLRQILSNVPFPGFSRDIVSTGTVTKIELEEGVVTVKLRAENTDDATRQQIAEAVRRALADQQGVSEVKVRFAGSGPRRLPVAGQPEPAPAPAPAPSSGPLARNIIGVASGKGGVGKSTVAVNLAVTLARQGRRVGFLDADVHGPSAPLMFGLEGSRPEKADANGRPLPLEAFGVKIMSMGFFVERGNAVIWRGPIVGNFIRQLLTDVAWGELDDLVIDFPPGTGDAQLTISQTIRMSGAVVVTTPNDLALIDALKAITMFRKVEIPVLGIVENMSFFVCPGCGEEHAIFGSGGADRAVRDESIPLLGRVPIDPQVVLESDKGRPVVIDRPDCPAARAYAEIAGAVVEASEAPERPQDGPASFLDRFGGE